MPSKKSAFVMILFKTETPNELAGDRNRPPGHLLEGKMMMMIAVLLFIITTSNRKSMYWSTVSQQGSAT